MVYLLFAVIWLTVGVAVLVLDYLSPQPSVHPVIGWLGLVLCAYNLVRWWSIRSTSGRQYPVMEARARRRRREEPVAEEPRIPDANFDFTEPRRPEERS